MQLRCITDGHTFPDDDPNAEQLEDGTRLCGFHVDELLGKAPTPSTDSIGRVITHRKQPKTRAAFSNSLGTFAPKRKIFDSLHGVKGAELKSDVVGYVRAGSAGNINSPFWTLHSTYAAVALCEATLGRTSRKGFHQL